MPSAAHLVDLASRYLDANPYGFLVTHGSGGGPHARLVQHLASDADRIWIGTSPRSRKAIDVAGSPQVAYAVEDRAAFAYVTFHGAASVVDDLGVRAQRWAEGLEAFFPGGPRGTDFVLLSVLVDRIEIMDFAEGVHPDPYGLVPAVVERAGASWVLTQAERRR